MQFLTTLAAFSTEDSTSLFHPASTPGIHSSEVFPFTQSSHFSVPAPLMLLRFVVFQPRRLNFRVLLRVKIRWHPIVFPQYWMPRSSLELRPSKAFPSLPCHCLHNSSSPCGPSVSEWRCFSTCRSSTGYPASFRPIATPEYHEQRVVLHFLKFNLPSWAS